MAAPKLKQVYENSVVLLEATNNYMKPAKANTLINLAQSELFNTLAGSLWQYRPKSPDTPISPQVTSAVAMLLLPYWRSVSLNQTNGIWEFPPNTINQFGQLVSINLTFPSGVLGVTTILTNPQYRDRLTSPSQPPSEESAIVGYSSNGFVIAPTPSTAEMIYYESPALVEIPFINGVPDFDNIPDIGWSYRALPFLTMLVVRNFGIPINSPALIQIAEQLSKLTL